MDHVHGPSFQICGLDMKSLKQHEKVRISEAVQHDGENSNESTKENVE